MDRELSVNQIEDLRLICEEEFEEQCTTEQARQMAVRLFDLYECLKQVGSDPDIDWEGLANDLELPEQPSVP